MDRPKEAQDRPGALASKTAVVADDEFDMVNSIQAVLRDEGFRVLTCSDGFEALSLLRETKPDLFISDVMMPKLSGFDVVRAMKDLPELRETKTILMSAIRHLDAKECRQAKLIAKPFTIEQLLEAVKEG